MDIDPPVPPSSTRKKLKFTPKPQKHRKKTPVLAINDSDDDDVDAETKKKLLRITERMGTRSSKVEKKSSGKVATLNEVGSSRTEDQPKDVNNKSGSNLKELSEKGFKVSSSTAAKDGGFDYMVVDDDSAHSSDSENEYQEPWDPHSYNPLSLPLRLPGSGNPEVLNEQEFGEEKEYEETKINSALELGLNGPPDYENKQMIFFQFPEKLPLEKHVYRVPDNSKGKEKVGSTGSVKEDASNKHSSSLKDLPDGRMGKMLVYKSGAIKLKLGDTIFDVSSGTPLGCYRSAAMLNTKTKNCCVLGNVDKQAVVTPDVNSILDNISQL